MVSRVPLRIRPVFDRARRDVGLDPDDRFDPGRGGRLVKFNRSMQVAVISDRDRGHLEGGDFLHQLFHPHGAIEQRVFGVQMKVDEGISRHARSL